MADTNLYPKGTDTSKFMTTEEANSGEAGIAAWKKRVGGMAAETTNPPIADTTTQKITELTTPTGMAASFTTIANDANAIMKKMEADLTPPNKELIDKAAEASKTSIKQEYDRSREEIGDLVAKSNIERTKSMDLLRTSPAAIKYNVDNYVVESKNFENSVSRSLERLTNDETTALLNADVAAANEFRAQKAEYYNALLTNYQNRMNFMNNAWSMYLGSKELEQTEKANAQTEAANKLSVLTSAFGGRDLGSLTLEERAALNKSAQDIGKTLGLPPESIVGLATAKPGVAKIISKGDYIYGVDSKGQILTKTYAPSGSGTASNSNAVENWIYGNQPPDVNSKKAVNDYRTSLGKGAVGSLILAARDTFEAAVAAKETTVNIGGKPLNIDVPPQQITNGYKEAITNQVMKSPDAVANIIRGYPATTIPGRERATVQEVVSQAVDKLIPPAYISKFIADSKNPFMTMSGYNLPASSEDSQVYDLAEPTK